MTVLEAFQNKESSYPSDKFIKDLEVYDLYFSYFKTQKESINILEIGVKKGGSLYAWKKYFGDQANNIVGIDINPSCKKMQDSSQNIFIDIGDQGDSQFLHSVNEKYGPFDIIIDDGSHIQKHHQSSLSTLFPLMPENSLYCIEDLHTCYFEILGGDSKGVHSDKTTLHFLSDKINQLNFRAQVDGRCKGSSLSLKDSGFWEENLYSICFYESLAVLNKKTCEMKPWKSVKF